ncbi:MAG: hypothetical protein LBK69_07630 [Syntrophomonadaceae bacterium]|nr:hypothetical protein [Syntrophomonadaceae bacterium]
MILVINNWKKKITAGFIVLSLLAVCATVGPKIMEASYQLSPVINIWMKDGENPSGNPMRVENDDAYKSKFDQSLDNFVAVIQRFYNKE